MRLFMAFFIFSSMILLSKSFAALSYGDGSDGDCSWTANATLTKAVWNCESIYVDAAATLSFDPSITSNIEFRSRTTVDIQGTIDVSAQSTNPGDPTLGETIPGPGGGAPGTCGASSCNRQNGAGSTGGEGEGGAANPAGDGAGGGGGSYGTKDTTNVAGGGPAGAGAEGAQGTVFGDENNFHKSLVGGRGGGAGGSGYDDNYYGEGGSGGGGGGAITVVAKEDISISGNILANGGAGSNGGDAEGLGTAGGGGGGGGSGGAIYIVSSVLVDLNNATLEAIPSTVIATGALTAGKGGGGGQGRIRIDDPSGAYTGAPASVSPTSIDLTTPSTIFDPLVAGQALSSDIGYACSYKESLPYEPQLLIFILGFVFILGLTKGTRVLWGFHRHQ